MNAQQLFCHTLQQRFLSSLKHVDRTQEDLLLKILARNQNTWFGQHYHFHRLRSVKDFQRELPICTYTDFEEPVSRLVHGETGVLTKESVDYFVCTSGTATGQQKLIPSTASSRYAIWRAILTSQAFLYQYARKKQISIKPGLMLVGTAPTSYTTTGIPCGISSTRCSLSSRRFWPAISIAPFVATSNPQVETRWYLHWYYALTQQAISYISAPYASPLLASAQFLFEQSDSLIHDIANGTLNRELPLSSKERSFLQSRLQPNPRRAAELTWLLEREGGLIPRKVWPDLGWLFVVHGSAFLPYQTALAHTYAYQFIWGMPYLASEGLVGLPYKPNSYSHIPALQTSFLEFIPENEWGKDNPRTVLLMELEQGCRYDVVITGWNGMYRYRLEDIVEIDGVIDNIPTFKVISRLKTVLSISGEKTTEEQIVQAVEDSTKECRIEAVDFVVDIETTSVPPCYCLWLESVEISSTNSQDLQRAFDFHLCQTNPLYALLKNNAEIGLPLIRILPPNTFAQFRQHQRQQGISADQMKTMHSIPQWKYIRESRESGIDGLQRKM